MRVRMLGPVDVADGDAVRPVSGLRRKAVLAVLGLSAGRVVSVEHLVDVVWAGRPPATAANTLQSHVSHLRGVLGRRDAIVARPPGYALDGTETDVQLAERLIRDARTAGGGPAGAAGARQAAGALRAALALWRGQPLADVAELPWLERQAERLTMLRAEAAHALVEARLALGEHAHLVAELAEQGRRQPFDEQVHGQHMLALYRSGRQADALEAYQRLRQRLGEELGIEPGPAVRDLHARILRQEPALDPPLQAVEVRAAAPVPRELPPAVPAFTGRSAELAALGAVLTPRDAPATLPVAVLCGTGGVGKTSLALQWAHQAAELFPDGQLHVDLRGAHRDEPLAPEAALGAMLRSLGVAPADLPPDLPGRSTRWRSLTAGRRILVVLDNALSAAQVRPLLPGTAGCAVLVTSRDALAGLVARDGAQRIRLDVLPPEDAVTLLTRLAGERAGLEPDAAATLAEQCARLPLAVRIAAELAAGRPGTPLAELSAELAGVRGRLDLLDTGEDDSAVRAVFSWSERHLPAAAARLFWLLGLHPGREIGAEAAAALAAPREGAGAAPREGAGAAPREGAGAAARERAGTASREGAGAAACHGTRAVPRHETGAAPCHETGAAVRLMEVLERAHLVDRVAGGRWTMHDLLRDYARERAAADLAAGERDAALAELYTHYLTGTVAASSAVFGAGPADPAAVSKARAWLDLERPNLVAAVLAATGATVGTAVALGRAVQRFLRVGYHVADSLAVNRHLLDLATARDDLAAQATALFELGTARGRDERYQESITDLQRAMRLYERLGDPVGAAKALGCIGSNEFQLGRYDAALAHKREALRALRAAGHRTGEARELSNIGRIHWLRGRPRLAVRCYELAGAMYADLGDRVGQGRNLLDLAEVHQRHRRHEQARDCHERARRILHDVGDVTAEAVAIAGLGRTDAECGQDRAAVARLRRALRMFEGVADRLGEAEARIALGDAHLLAGRAADALREHRRALAIAADISERRLEAEALNGIGRALRPDRPAEAAAAHRRALLVARELGEPDRAAQALDGLGAAHAALGDAVSAARCRREALDGYRALGLPPPDQPEPALDGAARHSRAS
ncbi:BTAD domain-containing putative transcriptional regulator [Dactylosporangium sp. NPDC050688]|uniref:AfsR/SARP family transcriptional regulator n=1 Tax=Dactylosporangium sp. NPDC050688 TaxID=3157217 RepID=UPI0033D4F4C0